MMIFSNWCIGRFGLIAVFVLLAILPQVAIGDLNEWSLLGLEDEFVSTLCVLRDDPNIMVAGGLGIFRSTDSGASWDTVGLSGIGIWKIIQCEGESRTLYAATDDGLYRSFDLGVNWNLVTRYGLFPWNHGFSVAVGPRDTLHILWGTGGPEGGYLSASHDGGSSWNALFYDTIGGIYFHPFNPERCYQWNLSVCRQSVDSGNSWDIWLYPEFGPFFDILPSHLRNRVWISSDSMKWTDDFGELWSSAGVSGSGNLNNIVEGVVADSDIAVGAAVGVYLIRNPLGEWELLDNGAPELECWLLGGRSDPPTFFASFVWIYGIWSYTIVQGVSASYSVSVTQDFDLFPNPFNNSLNLSVPPGEWDLSLYNILAQRVMYFQSNTSQRQIVITPYLGHISSGTYFLVIEPQHLKSSVLKQVFVVQKVK
jgi:hypothetical protein